MILLHELTGEPSLARSRSAQELLELQWKRHRISDRLRVSTRYVAQNKPFSLLDADLWVIRDARPEEIPAPHLIFGYIRVSAAYGAAALAQATLLKFQAIFIC